MAIKYNTVNNIWQGATWLKLGWQLFKQQPITWVVMVLIFVVACVVGVSFTTGQFVVALFSPVFTGGIFLAMEKSARGERAQIEDLFSVFKHQQTLKQLLLIGLIGMVVMALNSLIAHMPGNDYMISVGSRGQSHSDYTPISFGALLGRVITWPWSLAVLFGVPLVAIKQQKALPALKSSLWVGLVHLICIVPFCFMVVLLIVVAVLPVGLGLLVLLPVLFCATYRAFAMIYSDPAQMAEVPTIAEPINSVTQVQVQTLSSQPVISALSKLASSELDEYSKRIVNDDFKNAKQRLQQSVMETNLPKQLKIDYFADYICISRRWFTVRAIAAVLLSLLSTGATYYIFSGKMESMNLTGEQWFINLLPWLCVVFALVSSYVAIARCINHTDIYVSADTIEIKHQPLPWFGNKRLQASNIKQLYVREKIRVVNERSGQTRRYYSVETIPHTGPNFSLLKSLESSQQALFIEQEIEKFLNIENQRVRGEVL